MDHDMAPSALLNEEDDELSLLFEDQLEILREPLHGMNVINGYLIGNIGHAEDEYLDGSFKSLSPSQIEQRNRVTSANRNQHSPTSLSNKSSGWNLFGSVVQKIFAFPKVFTENVREYFFPETTYYSNNESKSSAFPESCYKVFESLNSISEKELDSDSDSDRTSSILISGESQDVHADSSAVFEDIESTCTDRGSMNCSNNVAGSYTWSVPMLHNLCSLNVSTHQFFPVKRMNSSFCYYCAKEMETEYTLQCIFCLYLCHIDCRPLVPQMCERLGNKNILERSSENFPKFYTFQLGSRLPDFSEIRHFIAPQDEPELEESEMELACKRLNEGGHCLTFNSVREISGSIAVYVCVLRPLIREQKHMDTTPNCNDAITSTLTLAADSPVSVSISLETTARDLIEQVLTFYQVKDSPATFTLYQEDTNSDNEVSLRPLLRSIIPLSSLMRGVLLSGKTRLVIQEKLSMNFAWDKFELPELQNFLALLILEEEEERKCLLQRYQDLREILERKCSHISKQDSEISVL